MMELWDLLDEMRNKTGYTHLRGTPLSAGEYHLVVHVWILNDAGEFLISKRTPNKTYPGMWECTGGSAVAGDDSLTTALKESREELGIILLPENGTLFTTYKAGPNFIDVWIFKQNVDLDTITFQPDETCDAQHATPQAVKQMMQNGTFFPNYKYPYLDDFFAKYCK